MLRYVTPLRVGCIYLTLLAIKWSAIVDISIEDGHDPELGGLGPHIYGGLALITLILDLVFSSILKPKINWTIQSIIVLVGSFLFF